MTFTHRCSERVPAVRARDQDQLHERHPQRGQAVPEAERGEPHGGALLPGDLGEEPVRGRDQGRAAGEVKPQKPCIKCSCLISDDEFNLSR